MKTDLTLEVRGQTYEVELNESGHFEACVGDQRYHAESVEKLREKFVKATRQTNLDIRFCRPNSDGSVSYGIVTGLHASRRAALVRWNDGKRETIQSYNANDMLEPLNHEEAVYLSQLTRASLQAQKAIKDFRAEHKLDVWQTAKEIVEAKEGNDE